MRKRRLRNRQETDLREVEWPPPSEDPDEEPSHPGARLDELTDELEQEDDRGADT